MFEEKRRLEEYRQTGYYYIPTDLYDLLWSDGLGEWRMSTGAKGMRSCMDLDKSDWELDEFGYEIVLREFCSDPDKYKLEQVKHMSPLELEKLRVF